MGGVSLTVSNQASSMDLQLMWALQYSTTVVFDLLKEFQKTSPISDEPLGNFNQIR
jgi:hypothetical protein